MGESEIYENDHFGGYNAKIIKGSNYKIGKPDMK